MATCNGYTIFLVLILVFLAADVISTDGNNDMKLMSLLSGQLEQTDDSKQQTLSLVAPAAGVEDTEDIKLMKLIDGNHQFAQGVRPLRNSSEHVTVNFSLSLVQIISVDERQQYLSFAVWIILDWLNQFVKWEASKFGGVSEITVPASMVWLPDIGLSNSIEAIYDMSTLSKDGRVRLTHDGFLRWYPPVVLKFACDFNMRYFPFDNQQCTIKFESFTYNIQKLRFQAVSPEVFMDSFTEHGAWTVKSTNISITETYYGAKDDKSKTFSSVLVKISLDRKSLFFVTNTILPCILISVLVVIVFYLPPEAGEKISLGITVLLAFAVFQLQIAEIMPTTSTNTPILTQYVTMLMVMSILSIFLSLAVLNIHFCGISSGPSKRLVKIINFLARLLCIEGVPKSEAVANQDIPNDTGIHNTNTNFRMDKVKDLDGIDKLTANEIVSFLEKYDSKVQENEQNELVTSQWQAVARICDRIFLVLYIIATAVATPVFLIMMTSS